MVEPGGWIPKVEPELFPQGDYEFMVMYVNRFKTQARDMTAYRIRFLKEDCPPLFLVRHPVVDLYKAIWARRHGYDYHWLKSPPPEDGSWLINMILPIKVRHVKIPVGLSEEDPDRLIARVDLGQYKPSR